LTAPDLAALAQRCRVAPGEAARLDDRDPADRMGLSKTEAEAMLDEGAERLAALHDRLFAQRAWSVLLVLQGMDASGKDGAIKRLAAGLNPQGLRVTSFAAPNAEERSHDFLWRIHRALPPRGMVGVFNRSHYEDVLVPRVDPDALAGLGLPASLVGPEIWTQRLGAIVGFESTLAQQGTAQAKVFLHVSRDEQRKRLLARLDDPAKAWKFDPSDTTARDRWAEYRPAYEAAITATATAAAPWYVVPADSKPVARALVQAVLLLTMEGLDLDMPAPSPERLAQMAEARKQLMA
jgi:PPK2 family polyphosphate:nucleotide phosphotransferase